LLSLRRTFRKLGRTFKKLVTSLALQDIGGRDGIREEREGGRRGVKIRQKGTYTEERKTWEKEDVSAKR
jgi:hypothetical protein